MNGHCHNALGRPQGTHVHLDWISASDGLASAGGPVHQFYPPQRQGPDLQRPATKVMTGMASAQERLLAMREATRRASMGARSDSFAGFHDPPPAVQGQPPLASCQPRMFVLGPGQPLETEPLQLAPGLGRDADDAQRNTNTRVARDMSDLMAPSWAVGTRVRSRKKGHACRKNHSKPARGDYTVDGDWCKRIMGQNPSFLQPIACWDIAQPSLPVDAMVPPGSVPFKPFPHVPRPFERPSTERHANHRPTEELPLTSFSAAAPVDPRFDPTNFGGVKVPTSFEDCYAPYAHPGAWMALKL